MVIIGDWLEPENDVTQTWFSTRRCSGFKQRSMFTTDGAFWGFLVVRGMDVLKVGRVLFWTGRVRCGAPIRQVVCPCPLEHKASCQFARNVASGSAAAAVRSTPPPRLSLPTTYPIRYQKGSQWGGGVERTAMCHSLLRACRTKDVVDPNGFDVGI